MSVTVCSGPVDCSAWKPTTNSGSDFVACRFKEFDGETLLEYRHLQRESPETFAACVQHELTAGRLTMTDVLRLNRALRLL